jgi:hypothetical protein
MDEAAKLDAIRRIQVIEAARFRATMDNYNACRTDRALGSGNVEGQYLPVTRQVFLEEIYRFLGNKSWWAKLDSSYPSSLITWDESMGLEDGEEYWRRVYQIPTDAPGNFFPLPHTDPELHARTERIRIARHRAGIIEQVDAHRPSHIETIEYPADRRTVIYYRNLNSRLMNRKVSLQRGITDAWLYKIETAEFYMSCTEMAPSVSEWQRMSTGEQLQFLRSLDFDENTIKAWGHYGFRLLDGDNSPIEMGEIAGLVWSIIDQCPIKQLLEKTKGDLITDVRPGTAPHRCLTCWGGFQEKNINMRDDPNRPVQTMCQPVPHVYCKSCIETGFEKSDTCPHCHQGEGLRDRTTDTVYQTFKEEVVAWQFSRVGIWSRRDFIRHLAAEDARELLRSTSIYFNSALKLPHPDISRHQPIAAQSFRDIAELLSIPAESILDDEKRATRRGGTSTGLSVALLRARLIDSRRIALYFTKARFMAYWILKQDSVSRESQNQFRGIMSLQALFLARQSCDRILLQVLWRLSELDGAPAGGATAD